MSSTGGSDENPGAEGAPFQTLERALRQHRILLRSGAYPEAGVRIRLAPGRYELAEGLALTEEDRVPDGCRLVIDGGGQAVISGGSSLRRSSFVKVTDRNALARLQPPARGRVRELDLRSWPGVAWTAMGDVERNHGGWGVLVLGEESLPVSRWPNVGWGAVGKVLDRHVFEVGDSVPVERWSGVRDLYLHGFWRHDWHDEVIRGAVLAGRRVELSGRGGSYGLSGKARGVRRFAVLNVLEELDHEGEWCLDRETGKLYAWLPDSPGDADLRYARLTEPLFEALNCQGIVLNGIDFDCSRGDGVVLEGDGNLVRGCRFRHLGGTALSVRGRNNRVVSCDVSEIGGAGMRVSGGDRASLQSGGNTVANCHIWQVGRFCRAYHGGIHLEGAGNLVRGNLIHDVPHSGIFYGGNNHVIELNELFGTCLETGDGGALYSTRDWGSWGNLIQHNHIHHTGGVTGSSAGVCLDDCDSGDLISGNLFQQVAGAVSIRGGRSNQVANNVFVECFPAVHLDARGVKLIAWNRGLEDSWDLEAKLKALGYQASPWREAYPRLARIMAERPAEPLYNTIAGNVLAGGSGFRIKASLREKVDTRNNWYSDDLDAFGFRNLDAGQLTFRDMAGVWAHIPEFKEIPQEHIGLTKQEGRETLPDVPALLRLSLERREPLGRIVQEPILGRAPIPSLDTQEEGRKAPAAFRLVEVGLGKDGMKADGILERQEWAGAGACRLKLRAQDLPRTSSRLGARLQVQAVPEGLGIGLVCEGPGACALKGKRWEMRFRPKRRGEDLVLRGLWGDSASLSGSGREGGKVWRTYGWFSGVSESGDSVRFEGCVPWDCLGGRPGTGLGIRFQVWLDLGTGSLVLGERGTDGPCYLVMP